MDNHDENADFAPNLERERIRAQTQFQNEFDKLIAAADKNIKKRMEVETNFYEIDMETTEEQAIIEQLSILDKSRYRQVIKMIKRNNHLHSEVIESRGKTKEYLQRFDIESTPGESSIYEEDRTISHNKVADLLEAMNSHYGGLVPERTIRKKRKLV